jgi:membrane protein HdeD
MNFVAVMNIVAGLILCMGIVQAIHIIGKYLVKLTKWLGGFQTIIGIIAIIVAIIWWLPIQSIVAIIAGLILIAGFIPAIPALGKSLEKLAKWLGSFQTIIGIIAIIVGIWGLL